jgi:hypothetical protein
MKSPSIGWRTAAWIAVLLLAARAASAAARICLLDRSLPTWDEAIHGVVGVDLADAVRRLSPLDFLLTVNQQTAWPFVHGLMLAPCDLLFGNDYLVARGLSVALYAAVIVLLFVAGLALDRERGIWIGAIAATLAALSPTYHLFGTLAMLEMPGAFLLCLGVVLYARSTDERASKRTTIAAGIATTALFLCKYNFGLMWLVPLAIHEWRSMPAPARTRAIEGARTWLTRNARRPFVILIAIWIVALVAIAITGGGAFTAFGVPISIRSPGNGAYALYVVLLARSIPWLRRPGNLTRLASLDLSPRHRILYATVVLPLAIWFLIPYPSRFDNFFGFLVNRDSGVPLWTREGFLFYPRAFLSEYASAPAVGVIVAALAALPLRAASSAVRVTRLALVCGVIAVVLHRFHDARFLFTVMPLLWLCAAHNAVKIAGAAFARPALARLAGVAKLAGLAGLTAWGLLAIPSRDLILHRRGPSGVSASITPALDRVLELAGSGGETWLLGYSNAMSPGLLSWRSRLTHSPFEKPRLPERVPSLPENAPATAIEERITMLARSGRSVIAALPTSDSPALAVSSRSEAWADSVTAERLASSRDFVERPEVALPGAGFHVRLFEGRRSSMRAPPVEERDPWLDLRHASTSPAPPISASVRASAISSVPGRLPDGSIVSVTPRRIPPYDIRPR